jgi:hypothetical protein
MFLRISPVLNCQGEDGGLLKDHHPAWKTCGATNMDIREPACCKQAGQTLAHAIPSFIRTMTVGCGFSTHPVPCKTGGLVGYNHRSGISPCPEGKRIQFFGWGVQYPTFRAI